MAIENLLRIDKAIKELRALEAGGSPMPGRLSSG